MGIFRHRSVHRGSSNGYVQRPVQSRQASAVPQARPPAAQVQDNATPAKTADRVSPAQPPEAPPKPGGNSLLGGLTQNFGGSMVKQLQQAVQGSTVGELMKAQQGVNLTPEERAQVQQAAGVMQRLAGADGLWNRADLPNNVRQLESSGDLNRAVNQEIGRRWGQELNQRGLLGRALVNGHMRRNYDKYEAQGMQQARGMAKGQLGEGQDKAGVSKTAGHDDKKTTPEGFKKANEPISRAEMEKFQKTMDMLQEKSRAEGMPEVKFPNGVPAQFLKDLAEGKSPQKALQEAGAILQLKNGKTFDLGKLHQATQEQKASDKSSDKTPEKTSETTPQKTSEKTPEKTPAVSETNQAKELDKHVSSVGQTLESSARESAQASTQAAGTAAEPNKDASGAAVEANKNTEGSAAGAGGSAEAGAGASEASADGSAEAGADGAAEAGVDGSAEAGADGAAEAGVDDAAAEVSESADAEVAADAGPPPEPPAGE